jgi:DnaJ family protein C protein 3
MRAKSAKVKVLIAKGKASEALGFLNDLLKASPNATDLLLERADLFMSQEDLDSAMKDYQAARRVSPQNKRAREGVEKVSDIQEKEKNINYYEVMEVRKGASVSEVKDAYRKMVRKWHPDRFPDPDEKRAAEKKMRNVNRAFDVIGNEEKKRMYDQGIDPDTGMGEGGGGGNPFQGGFPGGFPFEQMFRQGGGFPGGFGGGGGGRRFEFHFG